MAQRGRGRQHRRAPGASGEGSQEGGVGINFATMLPILKGLKEGDMVPVIRPSTTYSFYKDKEGMPLRSHSPFSPGSLHQYLGRDNLDYRYSAPEEVP